MRNYLASLLVLSALAGCGPSEEGKAPQPFLLRTVCNIQRWLERHDFRVRGPDVGRCGEAARQIEESRERARHVLREATEPGPQESEGEGPDAAPAPSP